MAISFKGAHFPQDIILMGVRWYVAYPLSYRHVAELMEERGVPIDHATIQRWVVQYRPLLEEAFHRRKRPVWVSWRMDETYIKVKGQWYYLYRAVDKTGQTMDFLLTAQRDEEAALRFLKQGQRRGRGGIPTAESRNEHPRIEERADHASSSSSAMLPRRTSSRVSKGSPLARCFLRSSHSFLPRGVRGVKILRDVPISCGGRSVGRFGVFLHSVPPWSSPLIVDG